MDAKGREYEESTGKFRIGRTSNSAGATKRGESRIVTEGTRQSELLKVVVQSMETKLLLTREGAWCKQRAVADEMLLMDPVEAIRLCLRLGIRNVKLTATNPRTGAQASVYPLGGDPEVKAQRKQVRKAVAEERRRRSQRFGVEARIKMLERAQPAA
jgi:hypothetical protein